MNQVNTEDKNIWSIELGKSVELLVEHQQNAADLIILRNWIDNGRRPQRKNMAAASRALWKLWTDFRDLQIEKDLIKRQKRIDEYNNLTQIVIQRSLVKEILPFHHEHCGHFGMARTFDRVRERFYWPGMKKYVHEWVSSCEVCCQKKSPHQKHIHSVTTWKPSHPFWQVALDFMGPLPESSGNKYILLIGNQFTKWYEAIPMRKDVHEWVISCEVCCQKKSPHQKHIHSVTTWKPGNQVIRFGKLPWTLWDLYLSQVEMNTFC